MENDKSSIEKICKRYNFKLSEYAKYFQIIRNLNFSKNFQYC